MSLSNNVDRPNPAIRFYQWNGAKGGFRYYDKTKKENVEVALPFRFKVLDSLSTIKGYSDANKSGYWSNEVRDIRSDVLTVRTKKGQFAKGTYEEIKGRGGMKFCQSVYVAIKENGKLEIANIQFTGAALSAWIEFRREDKDMYSGIIEVAGMKEGKKGITVYQIPVFTKVPSTPQADLQAFELDKKLQVYLSSYFRRTKDEIAQIHAEEIDDGAGYSEGDDFSDIPPEPQEIGDEDLPF